MHDRLHTMSQDVEIPSFFQFMAETLRIDDDIEETLKAKPAHKQKLLELQAALKSAKVIASLLTKNYMQPHDIHPRYKKTKDAYLKIVREKEFLEANYQLCKRVGVAIDTSVLISCGLGGWPTTEAALAYHVPPNPASSLSIQSSPRPGKEAYDELKTDLSKIGDMLSEALKTADTRGADKLCLLKTMVDDLLMIVDSHVDLPVKKDAPVVVRHRRVLARYEKEIAGDSTFLESYYAVSWHVGNAIYPSLAACLNRNHVPWFPSSKSPVPSKPKSEPGTPSSGASSPKSRQRTSHEERLPNLVPPLPATPSRTPSVSVPFKSEPHSYEEFKTQVSRLGYEIDKAVAGAESTGNASQLRALKSIVKQLSDIETKTPEYAKKVQKTTEALMEQQSFKDNRFLDHHADLYMRVKKAVRIATSVVSEHHSNSSTLRPRNEKTDSPTLPGPQSRGSMSSSFTPSSKLSHRASGKPQPASQPASTPSASRQASTGAGSYGAPSQLTSTESDREAHFRFRTRSRTRSRSPSPSSDSAKAGSMAQPAQSLIPARSNAPVPSPADIVAVKQESNKSVGTTVGGSGTPSGSRESSPKKRGRGSRRQGKSLNTVLGKGEEARKNDVTTAPQGFSADSSPNTGKGNGKGKGKGKDVARY